MAQSARSDAAAMAALAQQTHSTVDVVKGLYEEEIATLEAQATVKSFIGLIASTRVKRLLRARTGKTR